MILKDINKIAKTIIAIINSKIPNKIEKLERKYCIGIHTCNFSQKVKLSNGKNLDILINDYLANNKDTNSGGFAKGSTYDVYIGENESVYLVNSSDNFDAYSHDLEEESEYFEALEKVCEIMNTRKEKESKGISVIEILSKMK